MDLGPRGSGPVDALLLLGSDSQFTGCDMALLRLFVAIACILSLAPARATPVISYDVQSSTLGSGSASGRILADGTAVGTWSLSGYTSTYSGTAITPTATAFLANQFTGYSYGLPGIGFLITGTGITFQTRSFGYSVNAAINPSYASSYRIDGVTIFGRYQNGGGFYIGPNNANSWPAGSLTFSGFSGTATVSDPNNNLAAADGLTFTTGTNIGGYNLGNGPPDWTPAAVQWKVSTDAGDSMTYAVNYLGWTAANENTAFGFSVTPVPEPSTCALAIAGLACGGYFVWWRRTRA